MSPSAAQFEEGTTLDRYLMETLASYPGATGTFVNLCQSIALAAKMISARVNRAGLAGMIGGTGEVNIQGEFVQKLDRYADDTFLRALEHRGHTAMVVSEERDEPILVPSQWHSGRYVVTVDPLDGSSNIDVNATIGTIFGIFRRKSPEGEPAEIADALRPGTDLIAAGYVVYGSGTVLVLASEAGVHGFTLDPVIGEFFLSHPDIRVPDGDIYSCNEAYAPKWSPAIQAFLAGSRLAISGRWSLIFTGTFSRAACSCTRRPRKSRRASYACCMRVFRWPTSSNGPAGRPPMAAGASSTSPRKSCISAPR